jgi:hypothetical protein
MKRNALQKETIAVISAPASPLQLVECESWGPVADSECPALFSKEEFCRDRATD